MCQCTSCALSTKAVNMATNHPYTEPALRQNHRKNQETVFVRLLEKSTINCCRFGFEDKHSKLVPPPPLSLSPSSSLILFLVAVNYEVQMSFDDLLNNQIKSQKSGRRTHWGESSFGSATKCARSSVCPIQTLLQRSHATRSLSLSVCSSFSAIEIF